MFIPIVVSNVALSSSVNSLIRSGGSNEFILYTLLFLLLFQIFAFFMATYYLFEDDIKVFFCRHKYVYDECGEFKSKMCSKCRKYVVIS